MSMMSGIHSCAAGARGCSTGPVCPARSFKIAWENQSIKQHPMGMPSTTMKQGDMKQNPE